MDLAVVSEQAAHILVVRRTAIDADNGLCEAVKLHKAAGTAEIDLTTLVRMHLAVVAVRLMRSLGREDRVEELVTLDMEGMCIPVSGGTDWAGT